MLWLLWACTQPGWGAYLPLGDNLDTQRDTVGRAWLQSQEDPGLGSTLHDFGQVTFLIAHERAGLEAFWGSFWLLTWDPKKGRQRLSYPG